MRVEEHNGIHTGDAVEVVLESGFHAGETLRKIVKSIIVVEWTPEEQGRLAVPATEAIFCFTDGSTAGAYDRVRKVVNNAIR